jgi:hypothetical protein
MQAVQRSLPTARALTHDFEEALAVPPGFHRPSEGTAWANDAILLSRILTQPGLIRDIRPERANY